MCHDDETSAEQAREYDEYVTYIESLEAAQAKWRAAEDRIAVALLGLRRELVVLGDHLINLISAS